MRPLPRTRPPPGEVAEVAPGLLRVCLPLPGPPSHVNCWLIEDGAGWMLVDTGYGDEPTRTLWRQVFATALGGRPVTRVLVTHFHPDHVGLAGWICAEWDAPLLMPRSEWQRARLLLAEDQAATTALFLALLERMGAPPEHLRWMAARGITYGQRVLPLPSTFQPIADGQALRIGGRDWRVLVGAGHSPEMACLHDPGADILLSADHILPRISPHVGVQPSEPSADPLGTFLGALARFRALPGNTLVLPSHGEPFHGLQARIDALLQHHHAALCGLRAAAGTGLTAAEALPLLFSRGFEGQQLNFALAEALAHLVHLTARGDLLRRTDAGAAWRFSPAPGP
ncbi:MBL fold metallo-hydrolase [Roseomonas sp. SSH11]|uniref:MBL fold metallo-hydrolase n=1 Tax=Pararoseomonas baculiformis TaxID=2820812 RepID=A0ABS4AEE2_9PROT|nr:MBL fold metallo-hydrolase [Pararoseomonas baculiformis]MBP0445351.1 MBL fold metallo-hydrolase [Pararoseomonas baculiformis]